MIGFGLDGRDSLEPPMIRPRHAGYLGIVALAWFWLATVIFGALRPGYSHVVNEISELGVMGTPNAVWWNVLGFGVTGVLAAIVGGTIAGSIGREPSIAAKIARVLLVIAGLGIAAQGVFPAEMVNGVVDIGSPSTRAHFLSGLATGVAWLLGVLALVGPMRRDATWRGLYLANIVLAGLTIVASLTLRGLLDAGLAQRIGNAIFMVWYVLMSMKLVGLDGRRAPADGTAAA